MMWLLLAALSALSLVTGWLLGQWHRSMSRSDWWALVAFGVLTGGTLAYMLWVGTSQ